MYFYSYFTKDLSPKAIFSLQLEGLGEFKKEVPCEAIEAQSSWINPSRFPLKRASEYLGRKGFIEAMMKNSTF